MTDLSEFLQSATEIDPAAESRVQILNRTADSPLLNRGEPAVLKKKEAEWHRLAALLAARGYNIQEIAEMTGYNHCTVGDVLRQPHIKPIVASEIRRVASEDEQVITIVKENVAKAVETLATICNDKAAPKRDRIAAANAILDRRYGKPNQPIGRDTGVDLDKLTDEELAKMLPATVSTGTNV